DVSGYGCRALHVVVEGRSRRYQIILDRVGTGIAGADFDAGRINSLLVDQIGPGIDGALCSLRIGVPLVRSTAANQNCLGIGAALEVQSNIIQASLSFVVDADRATLVAAEGDRAQSLGLRCGRRR